MLSPWDQDTETTLMFIFFPSENRIFYLRFTSRYCFDTICLVNFILYSFCREEEKSPVYITTLKNFSLWQTNKSTWTASLTVSPFLFSYSCSYPLFLYFSFSIWRQHSHKILFAFFDSLWTSLQFSLLLFTGVICISYPMHTFQFPGTNKTR